MNIDIIVKVIIPILGAIVTYILVPFIKELMNLVREKTSQAQRDNIYEWVKIAVFSAEQMYNAGLIDIPKKDHVILFLRKKGIDISIEDLDNMIESAVRELKIAQEQLQLNK